MLWVETGSTKIHAEVLVSSTRGSESQVLSLAPQIVFVDWSWLEHLRSQTPTSMTHLLQQTHTFSKTIHSISVTPSGPIGAILSKPPQTVTIIA